MDIPSQGKYSHSIPMISLSLSLRASIHTVGVFFQCTPHFKDCKEVNRGFPGGTSGKELASARDIRDP